MTRVHVRGPVPSGPTVFDLVGGRAFFERVVDRFYAGVAADERLRHLYPEDLSDSRRLLAAFLAQYWGGPPAYQAERGHPRLRLRHQPFAIGPTERDAWLEHMLAALEPEQLEPALRQRFEEYFRTAADHLVNRPPT